MGVMVTAMSSTTSKTLNSPLITLHLHLDPDNRKSVRDVVLLLDREPPVVSVCADRNLVLDLELEVDSRVDSSLCTDVCQSLLDVPWDLDIPRLYTMLLSLMT